MKNRDNKRRDISFFDVSLIFLENFLICHQIGDHRGNLWGYTENETAKPLLILLFQKNIDSFFDFSFVAGG